MDYAIEFGLSNLNLKFKLTKLFDIAIICDFPCLEKIKEIIII